MRELWEYSERS